MEIRVQAFGIARDILSGSSVQIPLETSAKVGDVRNWLLNQYPKFELLASLRFAVNEDYVDDSFELSPADEVVIIPPVSGG